MTSHITVFFQQNEKNEYICEDIGDRKSNCVRHIYFGGEAPLRI